MALVVSATTNIQAQTAQAHRSIVGNYATGYENGKSATKTRRSYVILSARLLE